MQFYTDEQCRDWMRGRGMGDGDHPMMEAVGAPTVQGRLSTAYRDALRFSSVFEPESEVLLWVTEPDIWSWNPHLYYRFREGYGDRRLLDDAPGHLFLRHEKWDLQSYLQLAVQNGWDFWVLGAHNYARLFVSHDEWFEAAVLDEEARTGLLSEGRCSPPTPSHFARGGGRADSGSGDPRRNESGSGA